MEFYKLVKLKYKNNNTFPNKLINENNEVIFGNERYQAIADSLSKNFSTSLIKYSEKPAITLSQLAYIYNLNYKNKYEYLWKDFTLSTNVSEIENYIALLNNKKILVPWGSTQKY